MKNLKTILFAVCAVALLAAGISFAETSRLGNRFPLSFNPTKVVAKTAAYTLVGADSQVEVTAASANITITLPAIADVTTSGTKAYKIIKKDATAYKIVITPATGDTIGFESTRYLVGDEDYLVISASGGHNWSVDYESPYLVEDHEAGTYTTGIGSGGLYSATTASVTLTASACGNVYSAATGTTIFTLPATVANCRLSFFNLSSPYPLSVQPNASDYIFGTLLPMTMIGTATTYTGIDNIVIKNSGTTAQNGDLIELYGNGTTGWLITKNTGTWTMP